MISFILYGLCIILLIFSYLKDKNKTRKAFNNGLKALENIMPQFLFIIMIVGFMLSILNPNTISHLIGEDSGFLGIVISSIVGSITMMPTFVAFSTGNSLLNGGAGYSQVASLITTLTMVSVMTFSLEASYIGKKATFYRNFIAFLFSFVVAYLVGVTLS